MAVFEPRAYGPVFAPLLETDRRRPLDAGRPDVGALAALKKLSVDSAFGHVESDVGASRLAGPDMAACCAAGVWLLHDYLDESHKISQAIDTSSGSFWHAIMHRREGDFSNAKYWFRHVGQHPAFDAIGRRAAHVVASLPDADASLGETRLRAGGTWDPFAFVDLCQAVAKGKANALELCLDVQQAEWELLFDYCYGAAVT